MAQPEPPEHPDGDGNSDEGGSPPGPWALEQVEPTNLYILWPGEDAPTFTEVKSLFDAAVEGGLEHLDELDADDPEVQWNAVVRLADRPMQLIIWVEPSSEAALEDLGDEAVQGLQWVIGVETLLLDDDPIGDYAWLMKVMAATFDDSPAILDANTTRWFARDELVELFLATDVEPAAELLWIIHAVTVPGIEPEDVEADEGGGDDDESIGVTWLHTHGLWRCGLPELEVLEVPEDEAATAAALINTIGELMFELELPGPGDHFEAGPGIGLVVQRWDVAAQYLADETPGSPVDRAAQGEEYADAHTGVRAVICGPDQQGTYRKAWVWPREAIERLRNNETILYRSTRGTERTALMAQTTWPQFAMAFASLRSADRIGSDGGAVFLVKVGFPCGTRNGSTEESEEDTDAPPREHLWFEVAEIEGDRARGQLMNDPIHVTGMDKGEEHWFERTAISDWNVMMPSGTFEPGQHTGLEAAVDRLRSP